MRRGGICLLSVVYLLCWQFSNSQHLHNARASCYARGKGCHPGGPRQAGGMCWQGPYESQQGQVQGPAPGKDEPPAAVLAGAWLGGEQLCWKAPGHLGRQGAEHEPAECPGSKEGQQHPGLCDQEQSQEMEGTDHPLFTWHSLDSISSIMSSFGSCSKGKMMINWSKFSRRALRWSGLDHSPWRGWRTRASSAWGRDSFWEEPDSSPPAHKGRSARWSQALHSGAWWEDETQRARVKT